MLSLTPPSTTLAASCFVMDPAYGSSSQSVFVHADRLTNICVFCTSHAGFVVLWRGFRLPRDRTQYGSAGRNPAHHPRPLILIACVYHWKVYDAVERFISRRVPYISIGLVTELNFHQVSITLTSSYTRGDQIMSHEITPAGYRRHV